MVGSGELREQEQEEMTHPDSFPSVSLDYILDIRILAFALLRIRLLSCYGIGRTRSPFQVGS
jgi:hypothetical protein